MARVKRHIGMLLALALCVFAFHTAVQARAEPGNWHDSGVSCHHADTGTMRLAPMETHNWVFIRSQAPTCAVDGFRLYQCTYCSRQRTERLPAIGHNFAFTRTQTPTCTADGYRLYTCSN
ncbi:MAG: HNH endonuclease, partial [Oscillospiraceae bacterium]|nr:HNH endonuclease [Oscillospiraceae bacterium]